MSTSRSCTQPLTTASGSLLPFHSGWSVHSRSLSFSNSCGLCSSVHSAASVAAMELGNMPVMNGTNFHSYLPVSTNSLRTSANVSWWKRRQ